MSTFALKTVIRHGPDSLDALAELSGRRVLIVTDAFLATTPLMAMVRERLRSATVEVFSDVKPNPTVSLVAAGVGALLRLGPQAIVAVGGGSPIDAAKAMHKIAIEQGVRPEAGFWAIPTTSGSGSEVTGFSVLTDDRTHHKFPLISPDMLPDVAILDPRAVETAPPAVTADTGMDVVTHAVEAYTSLPASDFTDAVAEKAVQLCFAYLPRAHADGSDMEAREHMHNASCLAAIAFENAGLGVTHSLAHALGGMFDLPHGRLNAILLPHVVAFNAGGLSFSPQQLSEPARRYAHLAHLLGLPASTPRNLVLALVDGLRHLNRTIGIPATVSGLGVPKGDFLECIPTLVETALADPCTATNPRAADAAALAGLLRQVA